jgi:predicted O-linked N-acetylglucosamine transferase (SPINDLY family)
MDMTTNITIEAQTYLEQGNLLLKQGQLTEAIACYQQALTLTPNYASAHNNLGTIFSQLGRFEEAIACYQQALRADPNYVQAYSNLGNVFSGMGKLEEAMSCYQQALTLNPNSVQVHNNLGALFTKRGQLAEAVAHYQRILTLNPEDAEVRSRLGIVLWKMGKLTEAIACFQQVLTINANEAKIHIFLALALTSMGMIEEAIAHYRRAVTLTAKDAMTPMAALLLTLNYAEGYEPAAIFSEHQKFNEQYAIPLASSIRPHLNAPIAHRRLKIGYVSGDFRRHPVGYFMAPILAKHHQESFEIYCYSQGTTVDSMTQRLQQYSDHWITGEQVSDEQLAERIRQDQIDLLVDLAGYTAKKRLLVFARRPAPVQVTYLGYPTTTGLTAIDYRITDNYVDSPGINEQYSSEIPVHLPASFFCYQPAADSPPVNDLPALQQGYVTFGSFNNFAKVSPEILHLWANVLSAVPGSKLLIKTRYLSDPATRQVVEERFSQLGIKPTQLILEEFSSAPTYLKSYHQVDLGLDSYPFNGGTTTCEALWMGVPVVTLVGNRQVSRLGLSILATLGLTELIAYTKEEYLEICINLARNLNHLQTLRADMRARMQASPLMDATSFTRHLEAAYRKMWEEWCRQAQ